MVTLSSTNLKPPVILDMRPNSSLEGKRFNPFAHQLSIRMDTDGHVGGDVGYDDEGNFIHIECGGIIERGTAKSILQIKTGFLPSGWATCPHCGTRFTGERDENDYPTWDETFASQKMENLTWGERRIYSRIIQEGMNEYFEGEIQKAQMDGDDEQVESLMIARDGLEEDRTEFTRQLTEFQLSFPPKPGQPDTGIDFIRSVLPPYYLWAYYHTHTWPERSRDSYYSHAWMGLEESIRDLGDCLQVDLPECKGYSGAQMVEGAPPMTVRERRITGDDVLKVSKNGDINRMLMEWNKVLVDSLAKIQDDDEELRECLRTFLKNVRKFDNSLRWE